MPTVPELFWQNVKFNSAVFAKVLPTQISSIIEMLFLNHEEDGYVTSGTTHDRNIIAVISWDNFDIDPMLSLRLHENGEYDLYFQYYDDDEERYLEVAHKLTEIEIEALPLGARWLLKETIKNRNGQRIDSKSLKG